MHTQKIEKLKFEPKQDLITLAIIALVSLIQAFAINGFYVPHHFLSGGVTGVSLLLDYLFEFPTWLSVLILNLPIGLIGLKHLNPKPILFSFLALGAFSGAVALTRGMDFHVENPIISAIAGAAIIGVTSAIVVRRDATMGGIDIIASILSKRYDIAMGNFNIAFNFVIMGILSIVSGLELGLTSMLAMFVCNTAFNAALRAMNRTITVFIISDKWEEIAPLVMEQLHRGVTYIPAEGAYTGVPRKLVYCILRPSQLAALKRIVKEHDPKALFSFIETKEVIGRGFGSLN